MWIEYFYGGVMPGGIMIVEVRELDGLPNEELISGIQEKSWLASDGIGFHSKVPRVRKDFTRF